jgi:hypothetical protein
MLVAVGSMLKGQLLLVAPLFLLWPLLTGRWEAAWRWATGFLLAGALIVSPALVRSWTGALWVAGVVVAASVVSVSVSRSRRWETWAATVGLMGAALWPWILPGDRSAPWIGMLFAAVTVAATWWRPRARGALAAFVLAAALLTCGVVFAGSFAWLRVGFVHTAARPLQVSSAGMMSNLPGILAARFGAEADDPLWSPSWSGAVRPPTLGGALVAAYGGVLVLCALGLGRHAGNRDPRGLAALAAPWVLLFALLPRMQHRYLVWGAGMTALSAGIGRGLALVHVAVTATSWSMMAYLALRRNREVAPWLFHLLAALPPDAGWVVLAAGLALLGTALTRRSGTDTPRTRPSD